MFHAIRQRPAFHSHDGFMDRIGNMMNKLMGAHYGDRSFDVFDWIPLVVLTIASGLILTGLFPNGISSLGLTNGNLVRLQPFRAQQFRHLFLTHSD